MPETCVHVWSLSRAGVGKRASFLIVSGLDTTIRRSEEIRNSSTSNAVGHMLSITIIEKITLFRPNVL